MRNIFFSLFFRSFILGSHILPALPRTANACSHFCSWPCCIAWAVSRALSSFRLRYQPPLYSVSLYFRTGRCCQAQPSRKQVNAIRCALVLAWGQTGIRSSLVRILYRSEVRPFTFYIVSFERKRFPVSPQGSFYRPK